MLEADLSDGDLSQVTAAIQNALRPAQPTSRIIQIPAASVQGDEAGLLAVEEQLDGEIDDFVVPEPKRQRSSSSQKRTYPTPKVVEVDWKVSPSVDEFMKSYPPKTVLDKFLGAVAWFAEAGVAEKVSPDEVYTVFRKLGWSTAIKDFSQPLRDLKGDQYITGTAKTGFTINHLGLDRVKKFAEGQ